MIENETIAPFLKELRESADIQMNIFTKGSCFRLYRILKTIYPKAVPYWSDRDSHCITEVDGRYYDIGGEIKLIYLKAEGYYKIQIDQEQGYYLLKFRMSDKEKCGVQVGKYI